MALDTNKNLKLYYSISEVAEQFGVSESLLRFWEKQFPQINPRKSGRKVRGMKLTAAREALNKNRSGVQQTSEVIDKLRNIREELLKIKRSLREFE